MTINNFIKWLQNSPYAPYNNADIKDTNGQSILIRAKDDKGANKSLYYSFMEDNGRGFGHVYSCRTGTGDYWYSKAEKTWSDKEREEWKALQARKAEENKALIALQHDKVAEECKSLYTRLTMANNDHPYLVAKGIKCSAKIKIDSDGNLVIPAIDIHNKIWTLQTISPDGEKRFAYKGKKEGTFFPIGLTAKDEPDDIYICEGMATGASVHEATGRPVVVAWDAGNLVPVARAIHSKWPLSRITIAADNDQWTFKTPKNKILGELVAKDIAGDDPRWDNWRKSNNILHNKGMEMAAKAALVAGGGACIQPDFSPNHPDKPTDYNDMHKLYGLDAVRDRLLGAAPFTAAVEVVPVVVEHDSPSPYAPAAGDEIVYSDSSYDHMYDFNEPMKDAKKPLTRTDGNPEWFTDMIWDKEPNGYISNMFQINGLHDGKSMNNLVTFIRGHFSGVFVLNEFSDEILVRKQPPWMEKGELFRVHTCNEADRINMASHLEWYGFKVSDKVVEKAIISISEKDRIHPVRQYFDGLKWDKVERLPTWLHDYCGATTQPQEYLSSIGMKWLIAGVARIYQAGCQFSHMLVLEGAQDIGKSAILRELATFGDDIEESYFTDNISVKSAEGRFAAMMWQGKLIIEFGELGGLDKHDIETVKAWITRREDEYQKKGSNDVLKKPRQFILAGTTNKRNWINDSTGGKRFWPVACSRADVEGLKKIRHQLWAEAVYRYKAGERWWLADDDPVYGMAKEEQVTRLTHDDWQDILESHLEGVSYAKPRDIYEWLHIDIQFLDAGKSARIRSCMQALGYEYKQAYAKTGNKKLVWVKK